MISAEYVPDPETRAFSTTHMFVTFIRFSVSEEISHDIRAILSVLTTGCKNLQHFCLISTVFTRVSLQTKQGPPFRACQDSKD